MSEIFIETSKINKYISNERGKLLKREEKNFKSQQACSLFKLKDNLIAIHIEYDYFHDI